MDEKQEGVRLNKYLSEIGHCSRRAADKLIDAGRIQVNGQKVVMGQKVSPRDLIEIDGILIEDHQEQNVYLAFNKPVGIVCTTDTRVGFFPLEDLTNLAKVLFY
jgi:23S rRNA pseudouridine2604 synthase